MCIAIFKRQGALIDIDKLKVAKQANPDGWGLLWTENSTLKDARGVGGFDEFWKVYEPIERESVVIHFRTASSGEPSIDKTHPIWVNDDVAFVENGNLFEYSKYFGTGRWDQDTDIQKFNKEVIQKLPFNFLDIQHIRIPLEAYCIDNLSRMIFMTSWGDVEIIGEELGEWIDNAWWSNGGLSGYTGYGFSGAYYYREGDIRHKGGLISVGQFDDRNEWQKCPSCLGYYKDIDRICSGCWTWNDLLKVL